LAVGMATCLLVLVGCTADSTAVQSTAPSPQTAATAARSTSSEPGGQATASPSSMEVETPSSDDQFGPPATETQLTASLVALHEWTFPQWYVFDIEWAPGGESFIIAKDDVKLLDAVTFEERWSLQPAAIVDTPTGAEFAADGGSIYLYDRGWGLQVRDPKAGDLIRNSRDDPHAFGGCLQGDAEDATWAADGKSLLIATADKRDPAVDFTEINVWDTASLRCQEEFAHTRGWNGVLDVGLDGRYLAFGTVLEIRHGETDGRDTEFGQVTVWDLDTPSHQQICAAGVGTFARFRPGTSILASPDPDQGGIAYWDVETCEVVARISGIPAPYDLAFSPDGDMLFAVLDRLWVMSSDSGEVLLEGEHTSLSEPSGFDSRQNSISISPDGRYMLTYSAYPADQSTLVLWEIKR